MSEPTPAPSAAAQQPSAQQPPAHQAQPRQPPQQPKEQQPARTRRTRRPRRDAEANRERVLAAAVSAMLREGRNVPLATIADEAGVGVGTLYRHYADREALLHDLEHRAYALLNQILDEIDAQDLPGLEATRQFLNRTVAIADQLVLPLHGAPPLMSAAAVEARKAINRRLDRFIQRGRDDYSIRAAVNATDVIAFSAILTQPLSFGPDWPRITERQIAIFVNGIAQSGPVDIPGPGVTREDIETAFDRAASHTPHESRPSHAAGDLTPTTQPAHRPS